MRWELNYAIETCNSQPPMLAKYCDNVAIEEWWIVRGWLIVAPLPRLRGVHSVTALVFTLRREAMSAAIPALWITSKQRCG